MPPVYKPSSKRIIGIDPGTARVGWGIIDYNGSTETALVYGCIETTTGTDSEKRLQQIRNELVDILQEWKPTNAVIERLFFTKNHKTAMAVSESRGVILLTLADHAIPFIERTPLQVKQSIAGNGNADKKDIQRMVTQLLKLDKIPQPDDAADGLALALCGTTGQG